MKRLIQQSNHALGRVEDGCLLAIIAFMLIMSLLQIVLRNGFDSGLVWAETALRVSVLWAAMLGALRGSRHGGHIAIDIVQRYATGNVARTFQILTMLSS